MATEPITIQVDEAAARIFKTASPEQRQKLETLISLQLLEVGQPGVSLREIMRRISERAQARGLTPERLDELLDSADDDV